MEDQRTNPFISPIGMPDTVFDCIIPYLRDSSDRNAVSLVCRKWYEIEGITRKHVNILTCYATTPHRLQQRFHHLESLSIKGKPRASVFGLIPDDWGGYAAPWVHTISKSFNCLRDLHLRRMIVHDSDLEILAQTRGRQLQVLKLDVCLGFSTDGLLHIGKLCNSLKCLYLEESTIIEYDGEWLHELALHNTVLETLNFHLTYLVKVRYQDLILLGENCRSSLVSVKISDSEISNLVGFFNIASGLEEFGGGSFNKEVDKYLSIRMPPKLHSLTLSDIEKSQIHAVLPFMSKLRKLDLIYTLFDTVDNCLLIQRCPNLEILETRDVIGDRGLQVLSQCCKNLKSLKIERGGDDEGLVSHRGLIALTQGCTQLEYLIANVFDITNEALECIGNHLKNLCDLELILLEKEEHVTDLPLDNGVNVLLQGCRKLQRLTLYLRAGGLTDVGIGYIGQYGQELRDMLLGFAGESDAGLSLLSQGCPNLKRLELRGCFFSELALANAVLRLSSLRYLWVQGYQQSTTGRDILAMARPFWNMELIRNTKDVREPPSLLAYYSLVGQRTDFPNMVTPLNPN